MLPCLEYHRQEIDTEGWSGYPTLHWVPSMVGDVEVQEVKTLVSKKERILVEKCRWGLTQGTL